jgi:hypothetical protein
LRTPGLEEAAIVALRGLQADLLQLKARGLKPECQAARTLMRDRRHALLALLGLHGSQGAKEKHLEITNGEPLTICMGDAYAIRYPTYKRATKKIAPVELSETA